ncbi:hypothetical protein ACF3NW_05090 [Eikenella halliae]|uniref:hypothetical protein n=1 Tax=Eikenella halliae TaxID=1795832 RepID=UPI0028D3B7DC|nr:hypothetical protein [Eikenella halliae]
MQPLPYQPQIAEHMNIGSETPVAPDAQFYRTANGYWIAWQPETAAVLPPDLPDGKPCDWVEGAESLAELVSLIESGDYEALLAEDSDEHDHGHEHHCGCGCSHG